MRRAFSALLLLPPLLFCLAAPAAAFETLPEDAVAVSSPAAVLMEASTGEVIYAKAGDARRTPASVTKVMTLLLIAEAVDGGEVAMDDMVAGSKKAASMGGSQVWLEEGELLSVSDMIKCIAVVSANDCAVAMAEHLAGSEDAFAARMNARAAELGLENTHFKNCTGLFDDPEHYTSALDLAVMSRELLKHSWITDYTSIWMDSIRDGASGLTNTNKLVRFYEGCTGLKTGFTTGAMYCVSATAAREGVEYIAVIMGGATIEKRNEDAKALLSYGFANYAPVSLRSGTALPPVRVSLGVHGAVSPVCDGPEAMLLPRARAKDLQWELELAESVQAPVSKGDVLGSLTVSAGGAEIARVPIVAGDDVPRRGVWGIFVELLRLAASAV